VEVDNRCPFFVQESVQRMDICVFWEHFRGVECSV